MHVQTTELPGVLVLTPEVHRDERGVFFESWHRDRFAEVVGRTVDFVQDNHSFSHRNVLRGLHYQYPRAQGKLVRVGAGSVFDVAVDIRASSPTYLQWVGIELSAENHRQLWVPPGFAHGFVALTESADLLYKTTDYYVAEDDRVIRYDDPDIGVEWPLIDVILSAKDQAAPGVSDAVVFP